MVYFFLILIVSVSATHKPPVLPCSNNADLTVSLKHSTNTWVNGKLVYKSALEIDNLQNGATVCFDLITPNNETLQLAVQFVEATGSANFADQYEFGVPNVTAKCTCACSDKADFLAECSASKKFCSEFNGRCVTTKRQVDNDEGCMGLTNEADLCCAIQMRRGEITQRYKAFQVQNTKQVSYKLKLYPSYTDSNVQPYQIADLKGEVQYIANDDIIFETVTSTTETVNTGFLEESRWYIGESVPFYDEIYETTKLVNSKNEYDLSKVGSVKYDDNRGEYRIDEERLPDSSLIEAFHATVENCGDSDITSTFSAPGLRAFTASLTDLQEKHRTDLEEIKWGHKETETHGLIQWKYKRSTVKADFKLIFQGKSEKYQIQKTDSSSVLGEFSARVVLSKRGDSFIEINTTSSSGIIYATYTIGDKDRLQFSFEVTNSTQTYHHKDTALECLKNAVGKLCLLATGVKECKAIRCEETKIDGSEKDDNGINTDTVVSDGPLNWKTWAKFANPMEWFNGIDSYQEGVMLVIELLGLFGGTFMVIKILRMLNLLGKCCRCMFCCFLCPKTEKKLKRQAGSFYDSTRRRMTATRRRLRTASQGFRKSLRGRLNTAVAMRYLQSKREEGITSTVDTGNLCFKNPGFEGKIDENEKTNSPMDDLQEETEAEGNKRERKKTRVSFKTPSMEKLDEET